MNNIMEIVGFYINYRVIVEIVGIVFTSLLTAGILLYLLISWVKNKRR